MVLIKPQLTIIENNKLYLSRRPGIIVWFLLGLTIASVIETFRLFIDNIIILLILLLGGIIFGLDIIGEWEDIMLDRNQNFAIISQYIWSEKLFLKHLEKSIVMHLDDIHHVGAAKDMGLFFIDHNGKTITFNTNGLTWDEIENMKKQINFFLNTNRMKHSGSFTTNLYENLLGTINYVDQRLLSKNYQTFSQEFPSHSLRSEERIRTLSVYKRLSTPVLGSTTTNKKLLKYKLRRRNRINNFLNIKN